MTSITHTPPQGATPVDWAKGRLAHHMKELEKYGRSMDGIDYSGHEAIVALLKEEPEKVAKVEKQ